MVSPNITITASDVTGQRRTSLQIEPESSVSEMIDRLGNRMQLATEDSEGRPVNWFARHVREGRALHRSERVGDALLDRDEVRLAPEISAGLPS